MKKAVIIVGVHHAGKSKTINEHIKPQLGIPEDAHKFQLNGQWGFIFSQTDVESKRSIILKVKIRIEMDYELFVIAARPANETGSQLGQLCDFLSKASFTVKIVNIQNPEQAPEKAKEAFQFLNSI